MPGRRPYEEAVAPAALAAIDGDGARVIDPNAHRTNLEGSTLWQLALLELWLERHLAGQDSTAGRSRGVPACTDGPGQDAPGGGGCAIWRSRT
jgi:hypothetical protein